MIVADASALIDLLLDRPAARSTREAIAGERAIHIPHLADTEITHALRRWVRATAIPEARARAALDDFSAFPLVRYDHYPLTGRVWTLRDRFSAYDATYVALAEVLECTLVTADRRLASAAAGFVPLVLSP